MPDDHLDDDRLSAAIDGAREADAHLASCRVCAARAGALRAATLLVASPVSPLAAVEVDRLVAAAIDRADDGQVVPLRPRAKRRPPAQWLAAVAAVAALVVGIPVLLRAGGSGDDSAGDRASLESYALDEAATETTGGDDEARMSKAAPASGELSVTAGRASGGAGAMSDASSAPPAASNAYQEDLGDHADPDELATVLEARLSTGAEQAYDTGGEGPRCESSARATGAGRLGSLVYSARLRWRGEDAEALVFVLTEPAGEATHQAYVLTRVGCAVLAEPRF